jgi:hypothetical protein
MLAEFDKEAIQTRDLWAAKNAAHREDRPDSLGKLGTGSSLREERLFRVTIQLNYCGGVCLLPPIRRILEN